MAVGERCDSPPEDIFASRSALPFDLLNCGSDSEICAKLAYDHDILQFLLLACMMSLLLPSYPLLMWECNVNVQVQLLTVEHLRSEQNIRQKMSVH